MTAGSTLVTPDKRGRASLKKVSEELSKRYLVELGGHGSLIFHVEGTTNAEVVLVELDDRSRVSLRGIPGVDIAKHYLASTRQDKIVLHVAVVTNTITGEVVDV